MRITRKQFEKAQKDLAQFKNAEQTIKTWKELLDVIGPKADHQEVIEIERDDDGWVTWKTRTQEKVRVAN